MQVAAGINGKTKFLWGASGSLHQDSMSKAPSLTITSQPNPDQSTEFTPQQLAIWQSDGAQHNLWRYDFAHTRINDRDAVLIWQWRNGAMLLTARIISPDRIVEANCTPGSADENLYLQACEETVRTIKVAGPPSPQPPLGGGDGGPSESVAREALAQACETDNSSRWNRQGSTRQKHGPWSSALSVFDSRGGARGPATCRAVSI